MVLSSLLINMSRGTVSKAFDMSTAVIIERCAGFDWFRPVRMCCVSVVRWVVVEWRGLKPCCVEDRGRWSVILSRISLSRILEGVHSSAMGL